MTLMPERYCPIQGYDVMLGGAKILGDNRVIVAANTVKILKSRNRK